MELYTRDKSGKPRVWSIEVVETPRGTAILRRSYGQVGGKITTTEKEVVKGKNIGKANETTPLTQAQQEAKSLYDKQLSEGYVKNLDEEPQEKKFFPMLAHNWEDRERYVEAPFWVQPKLDGVRMLVGKVDGKLVMTSRMGKTVHHLDHIRQELEPVLGEGVFLDGESYNHSKSFEEITGMCRTTLESSAQEKSLGDIQFHVFDTFNLGDMDAPYDKRRQTLEDFFSEHELNHTFIVTSMRIHRKEDVAEKINPHFVQNGYEGTIVRNGAGVYRLNERSNNLLKFKSFKTEEYTIVDAQEAKGRDKGTVIWVCQTPEGKRFNVRPRGTQEERKRYWSERGRWTTGNHKLTVQYQDMTNGGVPRFPVGLAVRNYE